MNKLIEILKSKPNYKLTSKKELDELLSIMEETFVGYKKYQFIDFPCFIINKESGELLEKEGFDDKYMQTSSHRLNCNNMKKIDVKGGYIYVLEIKLDQEIEGDFLTIRYASYDPEIKKMATFNISESILQKFDEVSKKFSINKSKFVENMMMEFLEKNK